MNNKLSNLGRVPQLDGIRGMAILLVMLGHYYVTPLQVSPGSAASYLVSVCAKLHASGVDLFFVLSGFLIGGILLDNRLATNYFSTFYVRRFYRIVPLYAVWLIIFYLLAFTLSPAESSPLHWVFYNPAPVWAYLTFTQNLAMVSLGKFTFGWLGPSWSLCIEEHFYLVSPLLVRAFPVKRLVPILSGILLVGIIIRFTFPLDNQLAVYSFTLTRLDGLICGVLCAIGFRNQPVVTWLKQHTGLLYLALGGIPLGIFLHISSHIGKLVYFSYTAFALGYTAFLLLALLAPTGWAAQLTLLPLLRRCGLLAYGLYLFHFGINGLLHGALLKREPRLDSLPGIALTVVATIVSYALAHFLWEYFERRFVKLGHRREYTQSYTSLASSSEVIVPAR